MSITAKDFMYTFLVFLGPQFIVLQGIEGRHSKTRVDVYHFSLSCSDCYQFLVSAPNDRSR